MESSKKGNSKINIFKKIKLSKNMSIIVSIILGIVAILIFSSTFDNAKENKKEISLEYTTMMEYTKEMEQKLKNVILAVEGVDSAEVMITFESSIELVISTTKETKTISSGTTETILLVETPVLVNQNGVSKPIVLQEKLPAPKSVFVVAKGADDAKVKLDIVQAIEVLFSLPSSKIEVLAGK